MLSTVFSISSLLLGIAILLIGSGLLGTLLALRAGVEGFSAAVVGLVMSAYFVGFVGGTFLCPRIIRRVGHIRSFAMFAAIASSTALLHALLVDPWFWAALRAVTGGCLVGLYMVIESWLNTQTPNERRGRVFAIYMATSLLALACGQFLIVAAPSAEFTLFAVVSMLFSLALVPVAFTTIVQPEAVPLPRLGLRRLIDAAPLGVAAALVSGLASGAFWAMGPLFAQRIGLNRPGIAAFMSAAIVGGALMQWPIGRASDRRDRREVLALVCAAAAVFAVVAFVSVPLSFSGLIVSMFLYGGVAFSVYSIGAAHLNDNLAREDVLEGSSGLLLLHGIGAALGPATAGSLMTAFGPRSLLAYFVVASLALAAYARHRMRRVPATPIEERPTVEVPHVRTTTAALQIVSPAEPEPAGKSG